ncbi:MAG: hypothetical protein J6P73_02620 [Bacteroidales bacterium]|nr:hypothetical protein [Bacteroidales bacterium]
MKKTFTTLVLILPLLFCGCRSEWNNPVRLTAVVDFTIYPNSIREYEINSPGGFKYYTSDPISNSRGIIVFRVNMDTFAVWDRLPPNNPNACCEDGECSRLVVKANFVIDQCNEITYNILDGSIFEGEGQYPLYPYYYTYDGAALRIKSFNN